MFERRKILQALAALPLIGDKLAAGHTPTIMNDVLYNIPAAEPDTYYGKICNEVTGGPSSNPLAKVLGEDYYTVAHTYKQRLEDEIKTGKFLRGAGGHDADIEALRSTSRCYKNLKQRIRDLETTDLLQRWKNAINNSWKSTEEDDFT